VSEVEVSNVNTGLMGGRMGNKGGLVVKLEVDKVL
jgi:hypothetical protein